MTTPIDFMRLNPAKDEEKIYMFKESMQLEEKTGFFGYLKGDFGSSENFRYIWLDGCRDRKNEKFMKEFNSAIDLFREDPQYRGILKDFESMKLLCKENPCAEIPSRLSESSYGFRLDSTDYTYLIRCCTVKHNCGFCVYSYEKSYLDNHISRARGGIRFVSSDYRESFRIPDGGQIQIMRTDGSKIIKTCRYIDDYHLEVGCNLYHIAEFSEKMKQCGNTIKPYTEKERNLDRHQKER